MLVDELPLPVNSVEAASRFLLHWDRTVEHRTAELAPAGSEAHGALVAESWEHFIETSLNLPVVDPVPCSRCDGTGTLIRKRSKTDLLAVALSAKSVGSRSQCITALQRPTFHRLQGIAGHFDGDLNAAAAFAIKLADLLEKDKP
jgi:hypothetical protein